ncbi:MAG: tetratricopeptide repeat protein, partial [Planctomycetales bacterium]|nr:tetratricopeptide repeat protein [Planctomycetales bacterium]
MKPSLCRLLAVAIFAVSAAAFSSAAYSQAVALKKSTPDSQRSYNAAANLHNGGLYSDAAKLWAKFLADHPDDELAPRATHYLGICHMQVKPPQYAEAVKTYADVPTKFPTFENLDDALLNLGWCQYQLGLAGDGASFPAADKTFAKLIER